MTKENLAIDENQTSLTDKEKLSLFFACLVIIALAIFAGKFIASMTKKPVRKKTVHKPLLVDVESLYKINENVMISAFGEVIAKKKVIMYPKVSGEILSINKNLTEGSFVKRGEFLAQIDSQDYKIELSKAKASLKIALADFDIEKGKQDVAIAELKNLENNKGLSAQDKNLILRKPQLDKVRANVKLAKMNLKKAKLNLKRTEIKAPFNGVITKLFVERGSVLSPQTQVLELVDADSFYVKAAVSVDDLKWFSSSDAVAFVQTSLGVIRQGRVIKLLSDLEDKGKMARVLIKIDDPLDLSQDQAEKSPLFIGEYLKVDIEGVELKSIYKIKRQYFHDEKLYIISKNKTLKIISPKVIYKGKDYIYVNLAKGFDNIIVSQIIMPVENMKLRIKNEKKYNDELIDKLEKHEIVK